MGRYVDLSVDAPGGQKRASDLMELHLQMVVASQCGCREHSLGT